MDDYQLRAFYTIQTTMRDLSISRTEVYNLFKSGELVKIRTPEGRTEVTPESVMAYIEARKQSRTAVEEKASRVRSRANLRSRNRQAVTV